MRYIKNYFSGYQLFWMTFLFDVGMPMLLMTGPTIKIAHQNAWISAIVSIMYGGYSTFIAIIFAKLYPGKNFVQYSRSILGNWLGSAVSFLYVAQWTVISGIALRQVVNFIDVTQYQKTPLWVMALYITIVIWYVLQFSMGIETAGRMSNVIGPFVLVLICLTAFAAIPNIRWTRLLPVDISLEWHSIVAGSIPGGAFFAQTFVFSMIYPFVQNPQKQSLRSLWGLTLAGFFFMIGIVWSIGSLGPVLPGKFLSPIYTGSTLISVAEFIQNLDIIVMMIWLLSVSIRLIVYQFAAAYSWAELLVVRKWRNILIPILAIDFLICMIPRNNAQATFEFTKELVQTIVYPYLLILGPTCLLIIALFRRKFRRDE